MGILEQFGKRFFGHHSEHTSEKGTKTERGPVKKRRRRSQKRSESFRAQKKEQAKTEKKKKAPRESVFPESIPVAQKKSWQELIKTQKLVIFPITRNELTTTLSSVKALQEAILERRPDMPSQSTLTLAGDYAQILQRWLKGVDDHKIALFDTFLHRSNAQASRTEIHDDLLRVFQDSFHLIHLEKERRPTYVFRATVVQYMRELMPKQFADQTTYSKNSLPSPDELHRRMAEFFSSSNDKNLTKLEMFLHKAREVSDTPENKKAIHAVVRDAMKLIDNEKKGRSSYVYRGKILAGIGVAQKGGIASRDEFKDALNTWIKDTEGKNTASLEHFIRSAKERMSREAVSEDVRQVIHDVEVMLSESDSRRKVDEILQRIVPEKKKGKPSVAGAPPEEIQKVLISEEEKKDEENIPMRPASGLSEESEKVETFEKKIEQKSGEEERILSFQPNELRAQFLQRIGSPDSEPSVGQKYFENRLREWMELPETTDQQKKDALQDIQEAIRVLEADPDIRKRKEKIKMFQQAEEILMKELSSPT